ncbi:hypothetical protein LCGC14_0928870 [marine sediment metagenome]|uniref:Major tropism determinant N-terminal domain-containing protein n=1 Tax=marine sediment metagenome TaxID=412755 RepID=A0A0F9RV56_9ZZZZ
MEVHAIIDSRLKSGTAQGQIMFWDNTLKRWVNAETSELFWDDTNKRFGIGIASPGQQLHIRGSVSIKALFERTSASNVVTEYKGTGGSMYIGLTNNDFFISSANDLSAGNFFMVQNEGNVGIGISNPGVRLHLFESSENANMRIQTEKVNGLAQVQLFNDARHWDFGIDASDRFVISDATAVKTRLVVDESGQVGIGETAPETLLELTSTAPYFTLHNSTEENSDGGRESRINFKGEQDGTEETTLARIEVSHDGVADDEKGKIVLSVNDGNDGDTPTDVMTIDSDGRVKIGTTSDMLAPLNITGDTAGINDRHEGLWMRGKVGAWIVQLNVRGPRLEIGGGATLDTTPAMSVNYNTGEVGIGTTTPTLPLSVLEKSGHTTTGGFAVKLTNKTGGNTVAGQLVEASTPVGADTDDAFETAAGSADNVIGVVLDAGVADGSEAWVVVSGIADVLMDAGGSARGDRIISSATAGSADVWNVGGAVATHFLEIGHCIETRVGAGLARCILHFN